MQTRSRTRRVLRQLPDADLITRVRAGEKDAYGALWERHHPAAVASARAYTDRVEPEDVASEAFASIMLALRNGKGPTFAFRPYLVTVVRNTAIAMGRRAASTSSIENVPELEDPQFDEDTLDAALDSSLAAKAFITLPARWQEVLWYTEVENLGARETAALMGGVKPTAISALAYRAREGLRQAWIRAHLADVGPDSDCAWTLDRLPAFQRGNEKASERARIVTHLANCDFCPQALEEAQSAARRIMPTLAATMLGAGAASYLSMMRHAPAAHSSTLIGRAGAKAAQSSLAKGVLVTALAASVATAAVAAIASVPHSGGAGSHEPVSTTDIASSTAFPSPSPSTAAGAAPPASSSESGPPSPAPVPTATTSATTTTAAGIPTLPTPSDPRPTPTASGRRTPPEAAPLVTSPVLDLLDTAGGRVFPIASGTGIPGATVTIATAHGTITTTVNGHGAWASPVLSGLSTGRTQIAITQTVASRTSYAVTATVDLATVDITADRRAGNGAQVITVTGVPGSTIALEGRDGTVSIQIGATGTTEATIPASWRQLTAEYTVGDRVGPRAEFVLNPRDCPSSH